MRSLRDTIARINQSVAAGRCDNIGGITTPEADIRDRGELVTGNGMPEQLVGRFRLTPLSPWIRWTASTTHAFPSLCAAFDRLAGKGDR